jgi:TolA-binding protein
LKDHAKDGQYAGEAVFRRAYCAHAKKDYETSIKELRDYLKAYPGHDQNDEALVLLGDALCATGEIDEGISAYRRISPDERRFYEEGQFKVAKALRLSERIGELRTHLEAFVTSHPGSARLPEAIYWIGWSLRQEDQPDKARDLYWQTIAQMGGDASRRSMEDVFIGLLKLYKSDEEKLRLLARLRDLAQGALDSGDRTLAVRALWAHAQALRKSDPTQSQLLLEQASKQIDVSTTNPMIIADCAGALEAGGESPVAGQLMRDLIKWNPRAPQKDRAFSMLARLALTERKEPEALAYFERFERDCSGSVLTAEVLASKAALLRKRGQSTEAIATLEKLLADQYAAGQRKAAALVEIGDLLLAKGDPKKAFPYYQRVYVMYGRWTDQVAVAYLRSAEILEKLSDKDAARRTYEEMLAREDLATTKEAAIAKDRLAALNGGAAT